MLYSALLAVFSSVAAVNAVALEPRATTHYVTVGADGANSYSSCTQAKVGDTVVFQFKGSHTVTQSTFANPCSPISGGGFDSGVLHSGQTYTLKVTSTNPIWLYSAVGGECQKGFVTAINAPDSGNEDFDAFLANAKSTSQSSAVTEPLTATPTTSAGTVVITAGTTNPAGGSSVATTTVTSVLSNTNNGTVIPTATSVITNATVPVTSTNAAFVTVSTGSAGVFTLTLNATAAATNTAQTTITSGSTTITTAGSAATTTTSTKSGAIGVASVSRGFVFAAAIGAIGLLAGTSL